MSTMDLIKLHGGEPANFLDVGGGAKVEQVTEAFRILLADKNVKAVLVNIFGGIMRCTTIATAMLEAYKTVGFNVPLVVRLEGTEVEEGRKMLAESKLDIITANGLTDAAKKVVAAAGAKHRRPAPPFLHSKFLHRSILTIHMSILINKNTRVICQGITGKVGPVPHQGLQGIRHEDGRRRHARQRGRDRRRLAGVRHRGRSGRADRRRRHDDFRAAGRSPPMRFWKRSTPAFKVVIAITEGVPVLDMVRVYDIAQAKQLAC